MATALTARPLVDLALPDKGVARLAGQFALAVAGTLILTLSAKTKVVLGPVDLSMQTLAVMLIGAAAFIRNASLLTTPVSVTCPRSTTMWIDGFGPIA